MLLLSTTPNPESVNYVISQSSTITISLSIIFAAISVLIGGFIAFLNFDRKFNKASANTEQLRKEFDEYVKLQEHSCEITCGKNDREVEKIRLEINKEVEKIRLETDKKIEISEKSIQKDIKRTEEIYENHFQQYYQQSVEVKKSLDTLTQTVQKVQIQIAGMISKGTTRKSTKKD